MQYGGDTACVRTAIDGGTDTRSVIKGMQLM
jgi:hypothetical protein